MKKQEKNKTEKEKRHKKIKKVLEKAADVAQDASLIVPDLLNIL